MKDAKRMLAEGQLVEPLRKLTKWYDNPKLSSEESRQLSELLSELAGTVVYSRQHLLQPAYKVQPGDRLETIAAQYNVPWQLLAKINAIADPNQLVPGEELKVVRGPFSAIVDLDKRQLTLLVEDCYAGRFNLLGVGDMAHQLDGNFEVGEKLVDGPANTSSNRSPIHHWIGLGDNMWIVGTSDAASIHPSGLNLNARDAEDVYDILSMGSRVRCGDRSEARRPRSSPSLHFESRLNAAPRSLLPALCCPLLLLGREAVVQDPLAGDFVGPEEQRLADQFRAVGEAVAFGVGPAALLDHLSDDR